MAPHGAARSVAGEAFYDPDFVQAALDLDVRWVRHWGVSRSLTDT